MWLSATSHGIAVNKYRFIYTSALLTLAFYKTLPTRYTTNAATQAITHCPITTPTAHLLPSSLLMDAIAATNGVYRRQKMCIRESDITLDHQSLHQCMNIF